ncbi:hypothetical protein KUCAC02_037394, partial [Chaenocephalus aceratus]
ASILRAAEYMKELSITSGTRPPPVCQPIGGGASGLSANRRRGLRSLTLFRSRPLKNLWAPDVEHQNISLGQTFLLGLGCLG